MKKLVIALLLAAILCLVLVGCQKEEQSQSEESVPPETSQEPSSIPPSMPESIDGAESQIPPEIEDESDKSVEGTPFQMPEPVDSPHAEELLAVVEGFSREFLFPEFAGVSQLPFTESSLSSNLYFLAARGDQETLEELSETVGYTLYHVATQQQMTDTGKRYFGDDFVFPPGLECAEIAPIEQGSPYYTVWNGRGGMSHCQYLLLSAEEQSSQITATFLPYTPHISWDDGSIYSMNFMLPANTERLEHCYLDYPDDETRLAADERTCLQYCYLIVPQEELGTITVTFERAGDGRLVARSCVYNV